MEKTTLQEVNKHINDHEKVFLFIFAEWCGQCSMAKMLMEKVIVDYPEIVFLAVDVDKNELWDDKTLNITKVPTFIAYDEKKVIANASGYQIEDDLRDILNKLRDI